MCKNQEASTFSNYLKTKGITGASNRQYKSQVNVFIKSVNPIGLPQIDEIDTLNDIELLDKMVEFCLKNQRIQIRRSALQYMLRYIGRDYLIVKLHDELKNKIKIQPRLIKNKSLTMEHFSKLLKDLPEDMALVLKIMFETGFRISAVLNIQYEDIEIIDKQIKVSVVDKGGKLLTSYLTKRTSKELADWFNAHGHGTKIFTNCYQNFEMKLKNKSKEILGKAITTHWIKHTRSAFEFNRETPLEKIKDILHHSNISTTMIYKDQSGIDSKKFLEEREDEFEY